MTPIMTSHPDRPTERERERERERQTDRQAGRQTDRHRTLKCYVNYRMQQ